MLATCEKPYQSSAPTPPPGRCLPPLPQASPSSYLSQARAMLCAGEASEGCRAPQENSHQGGACPLSQQQVHSDPSLCPPRAQTRGTILSRGQQAHSNHRVPRTADMLPADEAVMKPPTSPAGQTSGWRSQQGKECELPTQAAPLRQGLVLPL